MTGILVHVQKGSVGVGSGAWALLEPAVSNATREIAHRVQALRSQASPAYLRREVHAVSDNRSLEECLFDALANAKILTAEVAMHLDKEWRGKLFRQLDSLHDPEEWDADDQPLQQSSFSTFLRTMLTINPERRPGLGLSHAGNLIAAWTTDQDRLTIEFLPDDRIRWVLSRRYADGVTDRFAADTSVTRLTDGLVPHHTEHWFSYAHDEKREPA